MRIIMLELDVTTAISMLNYRGQFWPRLAVTFLVMVISLDEKLDILPPAALKLTSETMHWQNHRANRSAKVGNSC